ncbi:MAG: helix-turn-helix domain-containing protein, partial [Hyphomonas sp.]
RKLTYQTGSFVIAQLRSANTLNDAIRSLAQHFNMMHGDDYNRVRQSENTVALVVDDSSFPYRFRKNETLTHFVGVALLIKVHCLLDSLSGGQAGRALRRVGLKQPRDGVKHSLVRFWQVPVSFGRPAYELVYDFDLACQPIPTATDVDLSADGIFARVIRHLEEARPADTRTFSARTEELVADGIESQQAAADRFGMSVATLRRRLDEENTSFREIVLRSRLKRADELLARGASITQVSEQLGYSDVRAFNRAFRKIRGLSPSAYLRARKNQIGIAPLA